MRKDIKIVLESIWYLILPVFIRLRRKTPSFSYGDIRRSETYAVMFTICISIK